MWLDQIIDRHTFAVASVRAHKLNFLKLHGWSREPLTDKGKQQARRGGFFKERGRRAQMGCGGDLLSGAEMCTVVIE